LKCACWSGIRSSQAISDEHRLFALSRRVADRYQPGELPARVYRPDLKTGQRALWKELMPSDPRRSGKYRPHLHDARCVNLRVWLPPHVGGFIFGGRAEVRTFYLLPIVIPNMREARGRNLMQPAPNKAANPVMQSED